jgi:hypothetical protein
MTPQRLTELPVDKSQQCLAVGNGAAGAVNQLRFEFAQFGQAKKPLLTGLARRRREQAKLRSNFNRRVRVMQHGRAPLAATGGSATGLSVTGACESRCQ